MAVPIPSDAELARRWQARAEALEENAQRQEAAHDDIVRGLEQEIARLHYRLDDGVGEDWVKRFGW